MIANKGEFEFKSCGHVLFTLMLNGDCCKQHIFFKTIQQIWVDLGLLLNSVQFLRSSGNGTGHCCKWDWKCVIKNVLSFQNVFLFGYVFLVYTTYRVRVIFLFLSVPAVTLHCGEYQRQRWQIMPLCQSNGQLLSLIWSSWQQGECLVSVKPTTRSSTVTNYVWYI